LGESQLSADEDEVRPAEQVSAALQESEARLAAEIAALGRLNTASSRLWGITDLREGLAEMLTATIDLLRADRGCVQLLDSHRQVLAIVAHQGLGPEFLEYFREVNRETVSTCGEALRTGRQVIVEDAGQIPSTSLQELADRIGFRGVITTPLTGRNGDLLGMISTLFREPYRPSETDLRRLDLYVRQAADFIERVRTEAILRESETLHRAMAANLPNGAAFVVDRDLRYRLAEGQALEAAGLTPSDLEGKTLHEALPSELADSYEPHYRQLFEGGSFQWEHESHGRHYLTHGVPLPTASGEIDSALAVSYDITDRKRSEAALQESEERFRSVFEQTACGFAQTDLQGRFVLVNDRFCEIVGRSREELFTLRMQDITHPDDLGKNVPQFMAVVSGELNRFTIEKRYVRPDGSSVWVNNAVSGIRDALGIVRFVTAAVTDMTDWKQAELALERNRVRERAFLDRLPVGIWFLDAAGTIVYGNEEGHRIWSGARYVGLEEFGEYKAWWHGTDRRIQPDEWAAAKAIQLGKVSLNEEIDIECFDGTRKTILNSAVPILDAGNVVGAVVFNQDITERIKSDQALRQALGLIEGIAQGTDDLIASLDTSFCFNYFNEAYRREFKTLWGQDLTIGTNILEALAPWPHEQEKAREIWARALQGESFSITMEFGPEHEKQIYDLRFDPVVDSSGQRLGGVHVLRNVTDRIRIQRALRASEERQRIATTTAGLGVFEWDIPRDTVLWENDRIYEIFGLTPGDAPVGQRQFRDEFLVPEARETFDAAVAEVMRDAKKLHLICPMFRKSDGELRWVEFSGDFSQDSNGVPMKLVGVVADITDRKQAEEALRLANRRKDEFLATLAHELRNPLAPIRLGLEALKRLEDQPEERELIRQSMERQTQQLISLVDDLLDVSRITQGKFKLRTARISLAEILRRAIETSRHLLEQSKHTLTVELPDERLVLEADPNRLAQVFSNLLNNAAKFTPPGGRISIETRQVQNDAEVLVRDNGIGIPSEMLDRVFEMFAQLPQTSESGDSGLGIGLTLVKSLVDMHGGSIRVASAGANQGSEFVVRLPIRQASHAAVASTRSPEDGGASATKVCRVLVADDNHDAATLLGMVIKMMGHELVIAHDGQEAVTLAEAHRPDLVLMDLGMPRMNGYEAVRSIRQQPWGKSMTIVALSGWGQHEDKRRTREAGFDHHLVKPIDPDTLQGVLNKALGFS
jgi:PAS domain S-box-containing protein